MVIEKWKRKDVVEKAGLSRRMRNERKKSKQQLKETNVAFLLLVFLQRVQQLDQCKYS